MSPSEEVFAYVYRSAYIAITKFILLNNDLVFKAYCSEMIMHANLDACVHSCVFKVITLVWANQPSVNFINILCTAFALVDPKSIQIQLNHKCLFMLLGSTRVKAVRRTLIKLSPSYIKYFKIAHYLLLCDV